VDGDGSRRLLAAAAAVQSREEDDAAALVTGIPAFDVDTMLSDKLARNAGEDNTTRCAPPPGLPHAMLLSAR
jgi:hypothetical protein